MSPISMATVGASSRYPAAPWTPASLGSGLKLWLDAADTSTVTTVSGGVSQWNDKSGGGRNATQATATARPGYASTQNGKSVLSLDGGDSMDVSTGLTAGSYSFIMVHKQATAATVSWGATSTSAGENNLENSFLRNGGSGYTLGTWPGANVFYITAAATGTTGTGQGRINGTKTALNTNTQYPITLALFKKGSQGYNINGTFGELVMLSGAASNTTFELLEGYLAHKWGLTEGLPAGHPYKSVAP